MKRGFFILVTLLTGSLFIIGCTQKPKSSAVEDLAYIKVMPTGYTDDADPEYEGIEIAILYYNSKSKPIIFGNVPMKVYIELYGYKDLTDTFKHEKMQLLYKVSFITTQSAPSSTIRIPFKDIPVEKSKYYKYGTIKVTVKTPQGETFSDVQELVPLYETK